ncbi:hypothetical protein BZ13_535 [Francisella philomiragia subsp. philomiragia ATCC 25015]|uniref:thiamine pyrophosphate-binding protein n=1 Tax=Francisella philomiragia TaxID=28110 RepID=UPI0001AF78BF|nr:thiamine pyrophosphate-binding protein [Francisella philomiragia]AJI74309.1 hypothetical protein BZ13_535 [Francisella philomiragia subsp. philomiragia ATCC 25015]MBK2238871.1 thiamine pyrophosphate-binding protein [Francisella philomiragia]
MLRSGKQILKDFFDVFDIEYVFGNPGTTETTFLDVVAQSDNCKYILGLHESVATGIAAGYALESGKPSVLNIHTYPGLANAMSNMFNAYAAGIPLFVIAGQQNRSHLIHKPILSGNLTELAKTATKTQYEVQHVSDLSIALQRCYLESLESKMPTFLSIPMEIYTDECSTGYFKKTKILNDTQATDLTEIINHLEECKSIVFVVDAEVIWSAKTRSNLQQLSNKVGADIYLAPFAVKTSIDVSFDNYKGVLPAVSLEANNILSKYETVVLLGEKIQSFLYHEKQTIPQQNTLIQFSNGNIRTRYDYPFDYVIRGEIGNNLSIIADHFDTKQTKYKKSFELEEINTNKDSILFDILDYCYRDTAIVIEGSTNQTHLEELTYILKFSKVYYEPRGGALGMAMPLSVGISLYTNKHTICFVGDGGSLYSIHSIWTAARYNIPVIFICTINDEYKILKQLWHLQVPQTPEKDYVGMDITNPRLDLSSIAKGFGAKTITTNRSNYKDSLDQAFKFNGPTFITISSDDC